MPSISEAVRKAVILRPCVLEALRLNIVNYSALARLLLDEVSKSVGRRVRVEAIKMALVRMGEEEKLRNSSVEEKLVRILANSSLSIINDVVVVTLKVKDPSQVLSKLGQYLEDAGFFQFTQGIGNLTLMLDRKTYTSIKGLLPSSKILDVVEDQAAVVLTSPREIIDTPGVISYLSTLVAARGVNLSQVVSCYTDTIMIVNSRDAIAIYTLFSELISSFRRKLREA